jgi:hypothetical protein
LVKTFFDAIRGVNVQPGSQNAEQEMIGRARNLSNARCCVVNTDYGLLTDRYQLTMLQAYCSTECTDGGFEFFIRRLH